MSLKYWSCRFPVTIGNRHALAILHSTMTPCATVANAPSLLFDAGCSNVKWGLKQGQIDAGEE
jgi:hypothetical protein